MILKNEYRDDLVEYIKETKDSVFANAEISKEQILENNDALEELWCFYQKMVEEYRCDPQWSYYEALKEVFGIPNLMEEQVLRRDWNNCSKNGSGGTCNCHNHNDVANSERCEEDWIPVWKKLPPTPLADDLDTLKSCWQEYMCFVQKDGVTSRIALEYSPTGKWLLEGADWTPYVRGWQKLPDMPKTGKEAKAAMPFKGFSKGRPSTPYGCPYVLVGLYYDNGSTDGEFRVNWDSSGLSLTAGNDSWDALRQMPELIQLLGEFCRKNRQPSQHDFMQHLKEMGYRDLADLPVEY